MTDETTTVYVLKDWTAASKMKNSWEGNESLRIKVDVLFKETTTGRVENGHKLTIYNKDTNEVVMSFYIDYGDDDFFSFTKNDAISMLNQCGFLCSFDVLQYTLPQNVIETLEALKALGYKFIMRDKVRNSHFLIDLNTDLFRTDIYVFDQVVNPQWWKSLKLVKTLRDVFADGQINKHDWNFLNVGIPVSIDSLLESGTY